MANDNRVKELRDKMLGHLEAALACADQAGDEEAGDMIERAIDHVQAGHWPTSAPRADL